MKSNTFDARRARAKRPLPLWIDAFRRDTPHLQTDEIGALILLLFAMWSRPSCDLDDNEKQLSQIAGVSLKLWRARVGPALRPFFAGENGVIFSPRLRREAEYVEGALAAQSKRRRGDGEGASPSRQEGTSPSHRERDMPRQISGINDPNSLKTMNRASSADTSGDVPTYNLQPTTKDSLSESSASGVMSHQSTRAQAHAGPTTCDGDDDDCALVKRILIIMGVDSAGINSKRGRNLGNARCKAKVAQWRALGLAESEIEDVIRETMQRRHDRDPPSSFAYFDRELLDYRDAKARPIGDLNLNGAPAVAAETDEARIERIKRETAERFERRYGKAH